MYIHFIRDKSKLWVICIIISGFFSSCISLGRAKIYSSVGKASRMTVCLKQAVIRLKVIRRGHTVFYRTYSQVYNRGVSWEIDSFLLWYLQYTGPYQTSICRQQLLSFCSLRTHFFLPSHCLRPRQCELLSSPENCFAYQVLSFYKLFEEFWRDF